LNVAVTIAVEATVTALVVTAKVAVLVPAGTRTLAGTAASTGLPLASVTSAPPAGAATFRVIVPTGPDAPPVTIVGLSVKEEITTGVTIIVAVAVPL